ncbi:hypothetical protein TCDM_13688 [Trypanosoma cruzi Dm28c]|uniref:Uncharacterized protein n=1 Tax=Trypanosoma cruzi Dm28c TaxID=1416333 RepID=V5CHP2_TRYCR|nr:hypothetical protein TCDM_13688 [Trypanosoma cruzi Dm28c]
MSSCSVGTITRAAARRHHNARAVKHPTRTAQAAASRCRWLQRTVAAVSSRSPNGVGRGTRMAGVVGAPCSRTATPVGEAVKAHRLRSNTTCNRPQHRHIIVLFYSILFTFSVCLFSLSLTIKISAHLHKRIKENTILSSRCNSELSSTQHHCRTGDRSHIAESAPQCAPHHRAVSNGLDAAMHRPAPFSHHSSIACPHKVANRIRVHTKPTNTLTR